MNIGLLDVSVNKITTVLVVNELLRQYIIFTEQIIPLKYLNGEASFSTQTRK